MECENRLGSGEDALDRLGLAIGEQVPVASHHFFSLMTDPAVDHALFNTGCSAIAAERMSQAMPAAYGLPFRTEQSGLKMVMSFVTRERWVLCSLFV